jgi:hypothetical protein
MNFADLTGAGRVPFAARRESSRTPIRGKAEERTKAKAEQRRSSPPPPQLRQSPPPARSTSADDHDFSHLHGAVFAPPPTANLARISPAREAAALWARVVAARHGGSPIPDPRVDPKSLALWDQVIAKSRGVNRL